MLRWGKLPSMLRAREVNQARASLRKGACIAAFLIMEASLTKPRGKRNARHGARDAINARRKVTMLGDVRNLRNLQ